MNLQMGKSHQPPSTCAETPGSRTPGWAPSARLERSWAGVAGRGNH